MMSKKDVNESLKRIIEGNSNITSHYWDAALAQNVGYVIKQLEEQVVDLRNMVRDQKIHVNIIGQPSEITGVKPEQTIVDDHWS